MDKVKYYLNRFDKLKKTRMPYDELWKDLIKNFAPYRKFQFDASPEISQLYSARKNTEPVFDSTPDIVANNFSSILFSTLVDPGSKWLKIEPLEQFLMEDQEVASFFDKVSERILFYINQAEAKFYPNVKQCVNDLTYLGNCCLLTQRGKRSLFEFSAQNINQIFVSTDYTNQIDTIYKLENLTARQVMQRFYRKGNNVSEKVVKLYNEDPDELVKVLNVIEPRYDVVPENRSKSRLEMPIKSVWIDYSNKIVMEESGYESMPMAYGRWDVMTGEMYGFSPSESALAEVKMLYRMRELIILGSEMMLYPPIQFPSDGILGQIDISPGAAIPYNPTSPGRIEPINVVGNIPVTFEMIQESRQMIKEAFYIDQMKLVENDRMTATEIQARVRDKMKIQYPMADRGRSELINPTIERCFDIAWRESAAMGWSDLAPFPEPPEKIKNLDFKIKYVTPFERAQSAEETYSIMEYVNNVAMMTQLNPETIDNINFDEITKKLHSINALTPNFLNKMEEIQEMRNRRQEAQQQQEQMMMAQASADIANKTGE